LVLARSANGTGPILGQVLKGGVGGDIPIRVSLGGIINIAANLALILFHNILLDAVDN
jgi:hypothetical protein